MQKVKGFSVLEIIIAAVIIIILAILIVPKMIDLKTKSDENITKAGLGSLRSAIGMYYADNEGKYPSENIVNELLGKYLQEIPYVNCPKCHPKSNVILTKDLDKNKDTGTWGYKLDDSDDAADKRKGQIWINCTHTDSKGNIWNTL